MVLSAACSTSNRSPSAQSKHESNPSTLAPELPSGPSLSDRALSGKQLHLPVRSIRRDSIRTFRLYPVLLSNDPPLDHACEWYYSGCDPERSQPTQVPSSHYVSTPAAVPRLAKELRPMLLSRMEQLNSESVPPHGWQFAWLENSVRVIFPFLVRCETFCYEESCSSSPAVYISRKLTSHE